MVKEINNVKLYPRVLNRIIFFFVQIGEAMKLGSEQDFHGIFWFAKIKKIH